MDTLDVVVTKLTLSGHSWCRDIPYCRECSHFYIYRSRIRVYIDLFTRSLHLILINYFYLNVATF